MNPYKQPVVTLKQWVEEKRRAINWKEYLDKVGFKYIQDDAFMADWDFTEQITPMTIDQIMQKYSDVLSENEISELKDFIMATAENEVDKLSRLISEERKIAFDSLIEKGFCIVKAPQHNEN